MHWIDGGGGIGPARDQLPWNLGRGYLFFGGGGGVGVERGEKYHDGTWTIVDKWAAWIPDRVTDHHVLSLCGGGMGWRHTKKCELVQNRPPKTGG